MKNWGTLKCVTLPLTVLDLRGITPKDRVRVSAGAGFLWGGGGGMIMCAHAQREVPSSL